MQIRAVETNQTEARNRDLSLGTHEDSTVVWLSVNGVLGGREAGPNNNFREMVAKTSPYLMKMNSQV